MNVATLLTLITILEGMGTVTKDIIDIRNDIAGKPAHTMVPAEQVAKVKAAMGSGGSVWDETHAPV